MRDWRGRDTRDWHERDFASDTERDDRFMPDYTYNDGSSDRDVAHHDARFARDHRADAPYYGDRDLQRRSSSRERGPHYGKGPQGFTRSDERIKELVSEALHDDEHVDATGITVEVKSAEVMLSGTVDDRRTKRMAEDCALRVSGVKDVQNQLRVRDQRASGTQDKTSSTTPALENSPSNGSKHLRS
ncbi:MAG TPA: BON domain-containing protein [Kofleriaceae bacterium]|nr:BON domain-containing protein [Kofleriaceae bacterium]